MLERRKRVTSGGEGCPRSPQESHRQRGTEVPKSGKTQKATSTFGSRWPREQQDHSARSSGSHSPRDAEESKTWFLFLFWAENSFLKLSIIFSHTKQGTDCTFCFWFTNIKSPLPTIGDSWKWLIHLQIVLFPPHLKLKNNKKKSPTLASWKKKIAFSSTHQPLLTTQIKREFISDSRH